MRARTTPNNMTSRSWKPSSLSLRPRRPSTARTSSASSTNSQDRASPLSTSFTAAEISESLQQSPRLNASATSTETQRITKSRPIAIELPPRRSYISSTPTPPEALSARGDILGGYFPLHEEIQRSYKTHPFHHDPKSALANTSTNNKTTEPRSPLSFHTEAMPDSTQQSETYRVAAAAPDPLFMAMPLGKYHPSNYKNKSTATEKLAPLTPVTAPNQPQHARKKSDIKKKLQQYQRDMVEQAALAGRMPFPGTKPVSPRLLPLGSPGPVTPMELEEGAGYLGAGARVISQSELMARMSRAEEEISRRDNSSTGLSAGGGGGGSHH